MSVLLRQGEIITSNKADPSFFQPENFRDIEFFRPPGSTPTPDTYGSITGVFRVNRTLNLINLGDPMTRAMILSHTDVTASELDPDVQYQGGPVNVKIHRSIIRSGFFKRFDGTIITTRLIHPSLLGDLEGPEEVVLFTDRCRWALSLVDVIRIGS